MDHQRLAMPTVMLAPCCAELEKAERDGLVRLSAEGPAAYLPPRRVPDTTPPLHFCPYCGRMMKLLRVFAPGGVS